VPTLQSSSQAFHIRQYRRFPVNCLLYFSSDELYGTGTIWNLSLGGWRVDSDVEVSTGTTLTLCVMLPDNKEALLVDQAAVCWSRGHEFGLVIREMKDQDRVRLRDFIAERIVTPRGATYRVG
jgi:hypothetical protein